MNKIITKVDKWVKITYSKWANKIGGHNERMNPWVGKAIIQIDCGILV
jgi:hypothetical protein